MKRFSLYWCLALLISLGLPALAQPATPVAKVVQIKADKGQANLTYQRASNQWYAGFVDMPNYVNDLLKTDDHTVSAIEFTMGGRMAINTGTTIEILGQDQAQVQGSVVRRIFLKAGSIWAKFSHEREEPQVQTSGGVMAIKGTEFVAETNKKGKLKKLVVLKGHVTYTPTNGKPVDAVASNGQASVVTLLHGTPVVHMVDADQERQQLMEHDFRAASNYLDWAAVVTGNGTLSDASYYAWLAADVVDNPAQAAVDYAESYSPVSLPFGVSVGGGHSKPDFPTKLSPDASHGSGTVTGPPTFSWNSLDGAKSYVVVISRDPKMSTLDWTSRVQGTTVSYPSNAIPLKAGRYYWRVIGIDGDGHSVGKASQTYFDTTGWGPPPASPTPTPSGSSTPAGAATPSGQP